MRKETFYIDGVDARSAGIYLQSAVKFSEAEPVIEEQTVPGRNGKLIFDTGSYENRSGTASCFCLQQNVERAISSAGRFLMEQKGYRRLETSDDPNHYWIARVKNSPKIAQRLRVLAPFDVVFDCKPQRFLKIGENKILFESGGSLFNQYGQIALPLISVYGQGSGRLTVGDCVVNIKNIDGLLHLDSDTQNAYNEKGNQNANIDAPVFPFLSNGEVPISFSGGIERIEIIPRWWEV